MSKIKILKIGRVKKGLTQKQLSEILGMSIATVNKIEKGTKSIDDMKVKDLKKLCKALDISINDVLNIEE